MQRQTLTIPPFLLLLPLRLGKHCSKHFLRAFLQTQRISEMFHLVRLCLLSHFLTKSYLDGPPPVP